MLRKLSLSASGVCVLFATHHAIGQTNPIEQVVIPLKSDSGSITAPKKTRSIVFQDTVTVNDAPWLRLKFDEITLGNAPKGGQSTLLRMTSLLDGAEQRMNAQHVLQWQKTSAYFNGDSVRIEIIADPGAQPSRIVISEVWAGVQNDGGVATICGPVDDRVLSFEKANARALPLGCTAWIIRDANKCFLSAGHCAPNAASVIQFNVPLSTGGGGLINPPPQDQYAVDPTSVQAVATVAFAGDDYAYFGCFPNSNTGLTPHQAQGEAYVIADDAPAVNGQDIRITGYGADSGNRNQVQQTHTGPYFSHSGTVIRYRTDTEGGNSGSPVYDLSTGLAIGIHTHGGCSGGGGSNAGTAIEHPGLQAALATPLGVCVPLPPPNDLCAQAHQISPGSRPIRTYGSVTDGPNEGLSCFGGISQIDHDIWFFFVADCTGIASIILCDVDFDSRVAAYLSCPAAPGEAIACNDDSCGSGSQLNFDVTQGTTYYIRVGGAEGDAGEGWMTLACTEPPCPGDIVPPNGNDVVNIDDLLELIGSWGSCPKPCPPTCPADIVPSEGGACMVNIDDLLALISAWGPCP